MRIAVCDDLSDERERLVALLREYCAQRELNAEIAVFESGEAFLGASAPGAFSLALLDIYMGGITGVETAARLKTLDRDCPVVFTTTSREHGADAFDLDAFHYLVKPIGREKLFSVLDRWYDALSQVRAVALKCGRSERRVLARDILYIDVLGRSCTVHTADEAIRVGAPLSAVEELLPPGEFVRPIRYCLAALRHIVSVGEDSLLLSSGERVPVSRRERDGIRRQLAAYSLRALRRR